MKNNDLQKLKERLDTLLTQMPLNSEEVLDLSHEIDKLIADYYHNILSKNN